MTSLLRGERTLAPDLPQLQRLPVLRAVTALQIALSVRRKVAGGYLSRPAPVIFTQAFIVQRAACTILFIRLVLSEQAAGAAGQPP